MLHHDNAATHKATIMTEYLHNERVELFPHLPCSPDRAPCNFFLFSRIKKQLKGKRFDKVENLARAVQAVAETIPKADYEKPFQSWPAKLESLFSYTDTLYKSLLS